MTGAERSILGEEALGQLRLAAVLAASDLAALGDVLCHRAGGLMFLLQALVAAPALVQVRCWPALALGVHALSTAYAMHNTSSDELALSPRITHFWPVNMMPSV